MCNFLFFNVFHACDRGGHNTAAKSKPEAENEPILKNNKKMLSQSLKTKQTKKLHVSLDNLLSRKKKLSI